MFGGFQILYALTIHPLCSTMRNTLVSALDCQQLIGPLSGILWFSLIVVPKQHGVIGTVVFVGFCFFFSPESHMELTLVKVTESLNHSHVAIVLVWNCCLPRHLIVLCQLFMVIPNLLDVSRMIAALVP